MFQTVQEQEANWATKSKKLKPKDHLIEKEVRFKEELFKKLDNVRDQIKDFKNCQKDNSEKMSKLATDAADEAKKKLNKKIKEFVKVELINKMKTFLDGELNQKIDEFLNDDLSGEIEAYCNKQVDQVKSTQEKNDQLEVKTDKLYDWRADLIREMTYAKELVNVAEETSPNDLIELSCRGEALTTSLKILKKIKGSRLE